MQDAREDRDRAWAVLGVAVVFATAGWMLLKRVPPPPPERRDVALDVTWIDRAPSPPPPSLPATPLPPLERAAAMRPRRARAQVPPGKAPAAAAPTVGDRPLTVVATDQAREWARQQAPSSDFAPDPLRRRLRTEPTRERFRWSPPPAPADVVRAIGTLVGGAGYTTDPCPQVRENIARLSTGGHEDLLQEELRRQAALCR